MHAEDGDLLAFVLSYQEKKKGAEQMSGRPMGMGGGHSHWISAGISCRRTCLDPCGLGGSAWKMH